jgi:hypothetical protein
MNKLFLALGLMIPGIALASGKKIESNALPPCYPSLAENEDHIFVAADFIYWAVKQEGNSYATTGTANTVPGTSDPNTGIISPKVSHRGSVYSPQLEAKPGFRVTLGTHLKYDAWKVYANYSYLAGSEESAVASNDINAGIVPLFAYTPNNGILSTTTLFTSAGATGFISNSSAHWHFQYNNVNFELARSIPLFCNMVLIPHCGLQGSWQTQKLNATYNVASVTNSVAKLGDNKIDFHQTFWGVGPRLGLDSLWECQKHFGIYADSAFALLWGPFKARSKSHDTNLAQGYSNVLIADQLNRVTTLSPMIELAIGISSDWIFDKKHLFVASIGWNAQVWFFQNQHSTSIPDTDLILQGLDVSLSYDF